MKNGEVNGLLYMVRAGQRGVEYDLSPKVIPRSPVYSHHEFSLDDKPKTSVGELLITMRGGKITGIINPAAVDPRCFDSKISLSEILIKATSKRTRGQPFARKLRKTVKSLLDRMA